MNGTWTWYGYMVGFAVCAVWFSRAFLEHECDPECADIEDRILATIIGTLSAALWPVVAVGAVIYRIAFRRKEADA